MTWRDVNKKLPPANAVVLCWDENHGQQLGYYSKIGKMWISENGRIRNLDPTHWQPLPAAPAVEEVEVEP